MDWPTRVGTAFSRAISTSLEDLFGDKYQILLFKVDDLVKDLKRRISVIPAKAGIQLFQTLKHSLDSGSHRSDDFLRFHQG
jgi:hypothetical protein